VDALFDFPLFFPLRRAFVEGKPLREVVQMLGRDHLYEEPQSMVTFLGLHDVARFMGEQGASHEGLRLAYTFLLTTRGTPLLYYGDEIGMPGGGDPHNRRDFPGGWPGDPRNAFQASGRTPEEQATFAHVQALLRLRAQRGELRQGPLVNLHVADQQYVYRRGATVVALNNDTTAAEVRIPATELGADVLGRCAPPRRDGDALVIAIPPRTGCVF
jgi:glycosidase